MKNIRGLRLVAGKKELFHQDIVYLLSALPDMFTVVEKSAELLTTALTEDGYLKKRYVALFDAIEKFKQE